MIRIEHRREVANLIKAELADRRITLKPYQFQSLLRYVKENNRLGEDEYNVTNLTVDVQHWLMNRRKL